MLHGCSLSRNNVMYVRRKIKNLDDFKEDLFWNSSYAHSIISYPWSQLSIPSSVEPYVSVDGTNWRKTGMCLMTKSARCLWLESNSGRSTCSQPCVCQFTSIHTHRSASLKPDLIFSTLPVGLQNVLCSNSIPGHFLSHYNHTDVTLLPAWQAVLTKLHNHILLLSITVCYWCS